MFVCSKKILPNLRSKESDIIELAYKSHGGAMYFSSDIHAIPISDLMSFKHLNRFQESWML